jgi:DNA repair protein RecO (recombination protein O)
MTSDEQAIVLNSTKIRDNALVLHTLGRTFGRKSFLVRTGAKARMSYFLPLNILELEITENPKSDLWYARPLAAVWPLNGIRDNIHKNTITLFLAEVLYRTVKDGTNEDGLYDWCVKQILTLDALDSGYSNFHIRFLLELCVALGFRPEASDLQPFSGEYQDELEAFMRADPAESMMIPLSGKRRNDIASALIRYLEFHTESAINIRSLQVLRELYGD